MPLNSEPALARPRANAFNDAVRACGFENELIAHLVDALEMCGDDCDRRGTQGALQYAAGGKFNAMLKSDHLVQGQAPRRVVNLPAVGLAEIGSERRAVGHGDLLKSPANAQDRP